MKVKDLKKLIEEAYIQVLRESYDPDQMQKDDEEEHGVAYDDDGRPLEATQPRPEYIVTKDDHRKSKFPFHKLRNNEFKIIIAGEGKDQDYMIFWKDGDTEYWEWEAGSMKRQLRSALMAIAKRKLPITNTVAEAEEPSPEDPVGDEKASEETVLEDATDTMLEKFPTLKLTLVKLMTEDFKEFVDTIDWVSPKPTTFRVNLVNGQDFTLKWTGKNFQAHILGKRYMLGNISEFQQALDKLARLYQEAPLKGAGEEGEGEAGEADFGGGGGGGDFPGEEGGGEAGGEAGFDDAGGTEEPADTSGDIDFEAGEEPEA